MKIIKDYIKAGGEEPPKEEKSPAAPKYVTEKKEPYKYDDAKDKPAGKFKVENSLVELNADEKKAVEDFMNMKPKGTGGD